MDDVARRRQARGEPGAKRRLLPERAHRLGVEFIEFAVDEESAERLRRLFDSARLLSWPAGTSRRTWNGGGRAPSTSSSTAEREGFAHASYITHGPGVCALGLRVEDAAAADGASARAARQAVQPAGRAGRARAAGDPRARRQPDLFHRPKSALARVWEVEFSPPQPRPRAGRCAGCSRSTTSRSRWNMTRCCPGCCSTPSIFDMERTPAARCRRSRRASCAARSSRTANGSVRIALNGAQSHRTLSGRFLAEFFGSGVQHIAFASDDILPRRSGCGERHRASADAGQLLRRSRGAGSASIPSSSTGCGRPAPLYDRDDDGEYLQLYTRAFRGSLLLRDRRAAAAAIADTGRANATIRLAAQARAARPAVPLVEAETMALGHSA